MSVYYHDYERDLINEDRKSCKPCSSYVSSHGRTTMQGAAQTCLTSGHAAMAYMAVCVGTARLLRSISDLPYWNKITFMLNS